MKICPSCMGGSIGTPRVCAECGADLSEVADRKGAQLADLVLERKYRLVEYVGEGAMGWVYRGLHLSLDSSVAVKLMKPSGDGDRDASEINDQRFAREARAASQLNNPHIISIMDFGRSPGGLLYIVSEFLRGITLTDLIAQEGGLPVARALRITDQILTGLEDAHASGLIHRDLKPDNIMITPLRSGEDFVKILDFGIAKLADQTKGARLTQQGQVIGTPTYMAPEQIRGRDVHHAADLYSLGAMLFEMLTGRPPFDSEAVMEVLGMHLSSPPPTLREVSPERSFPDALEEAIDRCLRKIPAERFASAGDLRKALAGIAVHEARRSAACPTCGASMLSTSKFCANCGAPLSAPTLDVPVRPAAYPAASHATADTALHPALLAQRAAQSAQPSPAVLRPPPFLGDSPSTTLSRRLRVEQTFQFALTGREAELDALNRFLQSPDGALEIIGPLGSGRSRLLRVAAELSESIGFITVKVGPDPTLARRPWYPVQRAVRRLLDLPAQPSRRDIAAAMERAGLAPEDLRGISELFGLRDPDSYIEHAVRLRETRAAALRALGIGASEDHALLLLVDDADELDDASRTLLAELAARADGVALKVILIAESSVLNASVRSHRVEPRPLTVEQVSELMETLGNQRSSSWSGRLRNLADHSRGLPLHVTQAVRLLAEGGTEVEAPLGDIIVTRVQRLPTEALRLLQLVSVVGRSAHLDRIASLLGQEPERFQSAIQLLLKRDLLWQPSPDELALTHPRIGDAVREAIPADARRRLHQEIFEELRAHGEPPIALARHAAEARLGAEALEILRDAGILAELMLDDGGAAIHYRRALHVARWELLLEEEHATCLDLSLRLGNTLRYSGDRVGALLVLREAVAAAAGQPAAHARALHALALVLLDQGDTAEALETIQNGVREAFFSGQPDLLNQIYMDLGRVLDLSGEGHRAVEELAEGVLMVTSGDGFDASTTPDTFWRLLAQLSDLHFRQGNLPGALEAAHSALGQADRHGSRIGAARCHFLLGRCYDRAGDIPQAEKHHARALAAFRQLGDRRSAVEVLLADASSRPDRRADLQAQAQTLLAQIDWRPGAGDLPS